MLQIFVISREDMRRHMIYDNWRCSFTFMLMTKCVLSNVTRQPIWCAVITVGENTREFLLTGHGTAPGFANGAI